MSQEKRKVYWRLQHRSGVGAELPHLNVTLPSQNLQDTLNYRCTSILFIFIYKNYTHPARKASPSGPGPCRADISLLKAPSSVSRTSSRALSSGFCSSTLLPEDFIAAIRCPGTRTTSTSLLEGLPGSFCGLFLSLVHTHAHTHTGRVKLDLTRHADESWEMVQLSFPK